jgi:hypothetical protein
MTPSPTRPRPWPSRPPRFPLPFDGGALSAFGERASDLALPPPGAARIDGTVHGAHRSPGADVGLDSDSTWLPADLGCEPSTPGVPVPVAGDGHPWLVGSVYAYPALTPQSTVPAQAHDANSSSCEGVEPVSDSERRRLLAEVRAIQDDQRYGSLSHPVMLGLLIAIDLLGRS